MKISKENMTKETAVMVKERFEDANAVGLKIEEGAINTRMQVVS